ncbi:GLPGLI family protein [Chryseobacterium sp. 5_R23647]|uniref:GLPGLI family protein n=1 Tax=Chryseobacterium sp. 5_R23647 TaxID=2258964 RepID=UPI000E230339|nr:GLPGLI family protein [Chryseobacterium sp. 5_R23647]REC45786.1 hypothetical protein DRF69_01325 [Chryseobacterium sp. 5_R23647]
MTLKILLTFISTAVFTIYVSAQNDNSDMEVVYKMKYIPDSLKKEKSILVDNLVLLFNNHSSIYFSQEAKNYYDYLSKGIAKMQNGTISLGTLPDYPRSRASVYKNGDIITATLPVGKYFYSFEEPKLQWTLLNDKTKINGIECSFAKTVTDTGDTFFAWYTMEYPFSEGPFRFKGLPGLILKVFNKNNTIEIEAVEIKKSISVIEPFIISGSIKIKNKNIYLKTRAEYNENPNIQNINSGIIIKKDGVVLNNGTSLRKIEANVFLD